MEVILLNDVPLSRSTLITVLMAQGRCSDDAISLANFVYRIAEQKLITEEEISEFVTTLIKSDVEIFSHSVDDITHSVRHLKLSSQMKQEAQQRKVKKVKAKHD